MSCYPRMHKGIDQIPVYIRGSRSIPICIRGLHDMRSPYTYGDQDQSSYAYGDRSNPHMHTGVKNNPRMHTGIACHVIPVCILGLNVTDVCSHTSTYSFSVSPYFTKTTFNMPLPRHHFRVFLGTFLFTLI
jgi:hypothetical protein